MNEEEEEESLSQSSYSLDLSQDTVNELMKANNEMSKIRQDLFILEDLPEGMNIDSSITVQRSLLKQNFMDSQHSYIPTSAQYIPTSSFYAPSLHHCQGSGMPPTTIPSTQSNPQPGVSSPDMSDCSSSPLVHHHHLSPLSVQSAQPFIPSMPPTIPSNMPFAGKYDFNLIIIKDEEKVSKTAVFTYSKLTNRAYIRRDATVSFTFSFTCVPPHAIIRCMAVHKTPELVGEVVQCCPKHVEEQKKRGHQHPRHFICGGPKMNTVYCDDPLSGRLSITLLVNSLQQKSDNTFQALFVFPCFTSELHKGPGQLAELIFTLEIEGHVVGRAVIDARICASPGRDRENDETKLTRISPSPPHSQSSDILSSEQLTNRSMRKRPSLSQNLECTMPTKMGCQRLCGEKQSTTITTYPELFPFVDIFLQMVERLYEVKVRVDEGESPLNAVSAFSSLESDSQTIKQEPQEEEEELTSNSQSTAPFIPSLSQSSSISSTASTGGGTLDILRIQVKRNFSSSSNNSSDNNN